MQESKIKKIINQLKSKKSCGKDNISSEILKIGAEVLAVPLTWIVNKSIVDKEFPTYWKEAIVKPLHKKGARNDLKNYLCPDLNPSDLVTRLMPLSTPPLCYHINIFKKYEL